MYLFCVILVNRVEIFIDEVFPELDLGTRKVVYFATAELLILDPEWINEVIPLLPELGGVAGVLLGVHVQALPTLADRRHSLSTQTKA